jgi:hypothetical protein
MGTLPGDGAYVWHGALHATTVADSLEVSGFVVLSQIMPRAVVVNAQDIQEVKGANPTFNDAMWVMASLPRHTPGVRSPASVWSSPDTDPGRVAAILDRLRSA